MQPSKQFGVLLVTGGRTHQENYAPEFQADPRCRLVGLVDEADVPEHRRRWNEELARKLDIPLQPDLDAALARSDVDIVSVCSEPERRARMAARAADAGKHVYLDKPLGSDLVQVRQLVETVGRRQVKSQMYTLLRTPWAARAQRIVETGQLGPLRAIHSDLLFAKGRTGTAPAHGPRQEKYPPPRFTFVDSKREVYTTAIYSLALITWLSGRLVTAVRAVTANAFFREHYENDVEDFGALLLDLEEGLVGSVTAGRIGFTSHPAGGPMRTLLVGAKGSVTIDADRPRLEFSTDEPPWLPPRYDPQDPMAFWSSTSQAAGLRPKRIWEPYGSGPVRSDQSHFVDCIEAGRESDMPVWRAAHCTEVILAAYRSAAEGRPVALPLA